ncbi:MAG: hypothetical protein Q7V63_08495 [Gammaproteobacteria bacterium]|nr:hypothetical protein [Gammaproteobacteria bacterium]
MQSEKHADDHNNPVINPFMARFSPNSLLFLNIDAISFFFTYCEKKIVIKKKLPQPVYPRNNFQLATFLRQIKKTSQLAQKLLV